MHGTTATGQLNSGPGPSRSASLRTATGCYANSSRAGAVGSDHRSQNASAVAVSFIAHGRYRVHQRLLREVSPQPLQGLDRDAAEVLRRCLHWGYPALIVSTVLIVSIA